MDDKQAIVQAVATTVKDALSTPFWKQLDFWIFVVLSASGLLFSILAFREARKAKRAATEAGRTVKIQTVVIELTEMSQKLERLDTEIRFNQARDLLTEISRRLRRFISAFSTDPELEETISNIRDTLDAAMKSLTSVQPTDPKTEEEAPRAIYFAVQGDFTAINNLVAELTGLLERKTMHLGDDHAN